MIIPSDKDYIFTKKIKQGKSKMNYDFIPLAKWIDGKFGVKTINIIYDTIDKGETPRLQIIFEKESDRRKFDDSRHQGYDKEKQKLIGTEFKNILKNIEKSNKTGFWGIFKKGTNTGKYSTKNIWVFFSAFEPIAKSETNGLIPQNKILELKKTINNKDIWEISRAFSGVTIFLFTDKQVEKYRKSEFVQKWTDSYFKLLRNYDEFGYFKREDFSIYLDSKENFDTNYESNWYYYYK